MDFSPDHEANHQNRLRKSEAFKKSVDEESVQPPLDGKGLELTTR